VATGAPGAAGRVVESVGLRRDGTEFPLELSVSHWRIDGALHFTTIMRDITLRQEEEKTLLREKQQLEVMNKAMMNREDRILELKGEVNQLLRQLGEDPRYS
jgi:hypothetical protein